MIRLKMDGDRMVYQLGGSVPVPRLTWREKARILKELWLDPVEIRFDRDSLSLLIARLAYLFDKLIKIDSSDDDVRDWEEHVQYAQYDAMWADEETYYDFGPYDLSVYY